MIDLSFSEISQRLRNTNFPDVDVVVGIGSGGIVVSSLVAHQLCKPLQLISVNYRNVDNSIKYDKPRLLNGNPELQNSNLKILLVDDVCVSGSTMTFVKSFYNNNEIVTFVLKGKNADIILFPEISECVNWPWNIEKQTKAKSNFDE